MTLSELLDLYQKSLNKFDTKTKATRQSIIRTFKATWTHGLEIPVRDVNNAQIEVWLAEHRKRMKKVSLNEYIRVVRHLFGLAVASKVIAESPTAAFKLHRPEEPIRNTPTPAQFEALVNNIRRNPFSDHAQDSADLVQFMGLAGVGMAECCNLLGEHIDFTGNKIALYRSKTDTGYTIPLFPQVKPLLQRLRESGSIKSGQPVFKVRDPKKALIAACKKLDFPNFTSRSLRRVFIIRAIELGVDFKTLASWQGHRDGGVLIAGTYSHLRNEHSDAMARKLVSA
jgi:integrase